MSDVMWLTMRRDMSAAAAAMAESWFKQQHQLVPTGSTSAGVAWHDTLLGHQQLSGWRAVAALGLWLRTAVPDLCVTMESILSVEQQHILLYYHANGTHTGPLLAGLPIAVAAAAASTTAGSLETADVQIPATGKHVTWTGSMVLRLQQDQLQTGTAAPAGLAAEAAGLQIVEVWHAWDVLFILQQIGHAPSCVPEAPAAAPAAAKVQGGQCLDREASGSQPQKIKAVVQKYFQTYNSGDFNQLPDIVHPSYHYWGLIDLTGKTGVAAMQAMMLGWRDALSDFTISHDWLLAAEGNRVIFRWRLQGCHTKGPLRGVLADPDNPRHITSWGITALSITSCSPSQPGQIWRKVSHANGAELLRQLGVCSFLVASR